MSKDMKKVLQSVIKKEVQKEVAKVVKREFTKLMQEYDLVEKKTGENIIGFSNEMVTDSAQFNTEQQSPVQTKNAALNEALNNTQGGISYNEDPMAEWKNMVNKEMWHSGDAIALSTMDMNSPFSVTPSPASSVATMTSPTGRRIDPNSEMGAKLDQVMNRDYSELVKRFNK